MALGKSVKSWKITKGSAKEINAHSKYQEYTQEYQKLPRVHNMVVLLGSDKLISLIRSNFEAQN